MLISPQQEQQNYLGCTKKGSISVGADADLVLFDPSVERTLSVTSHHLAVDYNAFEGMQVKGVPRTVLSRGQVIIHNGSYVGLPGDGVFIKRARYGNTLSNDRVEL